MKQTLSHTRMIGLLVIVGTIIAFPLSAQAQSKVDKYTGTYWYRSINHIGADLVILEDVMGGVIVANHSAVGDVKCPSDEFTICLNSRSLDIDLILKPISKLDLGYEWSTESGTTLKVAREFSALWNEDLERFLLIMQSSEKDDNIVYLVSENIGLVSIYINATFLNSSNQLQAENTFVLMARETGYGAADVH